MAARASDDGADADHRQEGNVTPRLDTAHINLHHGALAVGVVKGDSHVRRGGHESPLDPSAPGRIALWHPELGGQ